MLARHVGRMGHWGGRRARGAFCSQVVGLPSFQHRQGPFPSGAKHEAHSERPWCGPVSRGRRTHDLWLSRGRGSVRGRSCRLATSPCHAAVPAPSFAHVEAWPSDIVLSNLPFPEKEELCFLPGDAPHSKVKGGFGLLASKVPFCFQSLPPSSLLRTVNVGVCKGGGGRGPRHRHAHSLVQHI